MLTTREAIQKLLDNIRSGIIEDQETKGLRASGQSAKSLKSKTKEVSGNITGTLTGFGYFTFQERGRAPGGMPPVERILQWIKQKGIKPVDITEKSLAWAIAKKIQKTGSKAFKNESPRLAVNQIIETELESSRDEIRKAMFDQFKTDTTKIIKTSFQ
jgi:hypothetical protein